MPVHKGSPITMKNSGLMVDNIFNLFEIENENVILISYLMLEH